jgi:hypothetical protein
MTLRFVAYCSVPSNALISLKGGSHLQLDSIPIYVTQAHYAPTNLSFSIHAPLMPPHSINFIIDALALLCTSYTVSDSDTCIASSLDTHVHRIVHSSDRYITIVTSSHRPSLTFRSSSNVIPHSRQPNTFKFAQRCHATLSRTRSPLRGSPSQRL